MDSQHNLVPRTIINISLKYALYAFIAYVVYFLVMRLIGLATVVELRFLNYLFLIVFAYYALLKAEAIKQWRLKFLQAVIVTFLTGAASFMYFAVFLFFYSLIDPIVLDTFFELFPGAAASFGRYSAPFLIASEGISISSIIALGLAPFFQMQSDRKRREYMQQSTTN